MSLTRDRLEKIKKAAFRRVVRVRGNVKGVINLDSAIDAKEFDAKGEVNPVTTAKEIHNPRTDTPVAEYIYLRKIRDLTADEPEPDPKNNHSLVPEMDEFLKNPPPSLADDLRG